MKKLFLFLALMIGMLTAQADDYPYLTFKNSDGTELSVNVASLSIAFSDGQLIATNKSGTQTFTLQDLSTMCFMLRGDVDGNGEVDGNDIDMLANVIMGREESNIRCDMNEDDMINAADITVLVNIINSNTLSN